MLKKMPAITSQKCKARLKLDFSQVNSDLLRCGNVVSVGGGLRSALGAQQMDFSVDAVKVVVEHDGILYVLGANGLYSCHDGEAIRIISKVDYTACSNLFQGVLMFSGPKTGAYLLNGDSATLKAKIMAISMAVCCDRRFALEENNNIVVTTIGPTDWSDYFRVTPNTKLNALVAIGKKLYALGDTCYVFEPHPTDNLDVTFRAMCQGIGVVQTDTQATFGKKAVFATDSGLRLLQSDSVNPIFCKLNDFVSFTGSVACAHKGLYYVSCKRLDGLQEQNDVTLILDVHNEKIVGIIDMGWENLYSSGETLYATKDGKLFKLGGNAVASHWFATVDFDNPSLKFLDSLFVKSKYDAELTVTGDNSSVCYKVTGKNGIQRLPVSGVGRTFTLEIQAQDGLQVDYAELTARRYEV